MRRKTRVTLALVVVAAALAKRSYKNASLAWLVKRLVGFLFSRALTVPTPRVVTGAGAVSQVGGVLKSMGCKKPLVVTDAVLVKMGLVKGCIDSISNAGFKHEVFDEVVPNPTADSVEKGFELYRKSDCDSIVALGGGSPMDVAKVIGAKVANPKPVESYKGFFQVTLFGWRPLPPVVAIPTTAGTGSETTVAAVITLPAEHAKAAIADLGLVPLVAVLDPEVLLKLPKGVTAATGMDALTHAIESFLSGWASSITRTHSLSAVESIFKHLIESYNDGANLEARQNMLNASFQAGLAFTRAGVGYVHAIAHQFGGMFGTAHGVANAMLLPYVLEYYLRDEGEGGSLSCTDRFCEIAKAGGLVENGHGNADSRRSIARNLVARVSEMNAAMAIPKELDAMKASHVNEVAARALREAHGDCGLGQPFRYMLDLGYAVPKYMTHQDCTTIVARLLSAEEKSKWDAAVQ